MTDEERWMKAIEEEPEGLAATYRPVKAAVACLSYNIVTATFKDGRTSTCVDNEGRWCVRWASSDLCSTTEITAPSAKELIEKLKKRVMTTLLILGGSA